MTEVEAEKSSPVQRVIAFVVLLAAGIVSLPVAAYFLDDQGTENLIIPAALGGMALVGALVGVALPGIARPGSSSARAARVGAITGVVMTLLGVVIFFLILNGFDGA